MAFTGTRFGRLNARGSERANIQSGQLFGTNRGIVQADMADIFYAGLLLAKSATAWENSFNGLHLKKIGEIARLAERNLRASIVRPSEEGRRAGTTRQTGNFTFGVRQGGSFKGVFLTNAERHHFGFGYPNIAHADATTNYVWRSLEFGLGKAGVRHATKDQYFDARPIGRHLIPQPFGFDPYRPIGGHLILPSKSRGSTGKKGDEHYEGAGLKPKRFIRDAADVVLPGMLESYERLYARHFAEFG